MNNEKSEICVRVKNLHKANKRNKAKNKAVLFEFISMLQYSICFYGF